MEENASDVEDNPEYSDEEMDFDSSLDTDNETVRKKNIFIKVLIALIAFISISGGFFGSKLQENFKAAV